MFRLDLEISEQLASKLREFAALEELHSKEEGLWHLVRQIEEDARAATVERLAKKHDYQDVVATAIEKTLTTPMIRMGQTLKGIWVGGYTVVVLASNGEIIGAHSNAQGPSWRDEHDKYAHALTKALLAKQLHDAHRNQGLDYDDNQQYLQALMLGRKDFYLGDYVAGKQNMPTTPVFVGTSGCDLQPSYLRNLAPGILTRNSNALAGQGDRLFAHKVGDYLDPLVPVQPINEGLTFFGKFRRGN